VTPHPSRAFGLPAAQRKARATNDREQWHCEPGADGLSVRDLAPASTVVLPERRDAPATDRFARIRCISGIFWIVGNISHYRARVTLQRLFCES
jgi:hypothetical protein